MSSPPAVVLVDPETPGNVGTVARAMKNFGFGDLLLVDPPDLEQDGEAYGFAGHAREDVLPAAREVNLDEVVASHHTVGFTAHTGETDMRPVRYPFSTPAELAADLPDVAGATALVFGRESKGLSNDELRRLDRVAAIPASEEYPVLNLGQAVTVTLYELRGLGAGDDQLPDGVHERAPPEQVERLQAHVGALLADLDYRPEKRETTETLVRRVLGRADPTAREVNTLMGVLRQARQAATGDPDPPEP